MPADLASGDPADWLKQHDLARVLFYQAEVHLDDGDIRSARERTREALDILERVSSAHPGERDLLRLIGMARMMESRIAAAEGHPEETAPWSRAWDILQPLAAGSNDHRMLDPAARALILGGRADDARDLVEKLRTMGYAREDLLLLCRNHGLVQ